MVRIHCTGDQVLVVKELRTATRSFDLDCALLRGCFAEVSIGDVESFTLRLRLTRHVDVVCPRARATVTHGSASGALAQPLEPDAVERGLAPCEPVRQR